MGAWQGLLKPQAFMMERRRWHRHVLSKIPAIMQQLATWGTVQPAEPGSTAADGDLVRKKETYTCQ